MKRIFLILLLIPSLAFTISVGKLSVQSSLYQPLRAKITLSDLKNISIDELHVQLASKKMFKQANLVQTNIVKSLDFKVMHPQGKLPFIAITSKQRINEPYVSFLIKLSWTTGDFIKKYTLLLDPAPTPIQRKTKMLVGKKTYFKTVHKVIKQMSNGVYGPIKEKETLWQVAAQVRPSPKVTMDQAMIALVEYNPQAFLYHNTNGLMSGYYLRIPTVKQMLTISPLKAEQILAKHNQYWKAKKIIPLPKTSLKKIIINKNDNEKSELNVDKQQLARKTEQTNKHEKLIVNKKMPVILSGIPKDLQKPLAAVTKENEEIKYANTTLKQRLQELQVENKNLTQALTSSKKAILNLQNLLKEQAKQIQNYHKEKTSKSILQYTLRFWWLLLLIILLVFAYGYWVIRRNRKLNYNIKMPEQEKSKSSPIDEYIDDKDEPILDLVDESKQRDEFDLTRSQKKQTIQENDDVDVQELLPDITVKEIHRKSAASTSTMNVSAMLKEAKLYIDYGRNDRAQSLLDGMIKQMPKDATLWRELLNIYSQLQDEQALALVTKQMPKELLSDDVQQQSTEIELVENDTVEKTEQNKIDKFINEFVETGYQSNSEEEDISLTPLAEAEEDTLHFSDDDNLINDEIENTSFTVENTGEDQLTLKLLDEAPLRKTEAESSLNENKLDLARAYIEMENYPAAKKLLQEVIDSDEQQDKIFAKKLLAKLE